MSFEITKLDEKQIESLPLSAIEDLKFTNLQNSDLLTYEASSNSWVNSNIIDGGNSSTGQTAIQFRRATEAQWIASNPILAQGEVGLEVNTNQFKFGDGISHWNELNYRKTYTTAGVTKNDPILIDNGNLTVSASACEVVLYVNDDYSDIPHIYSVAGATLPIADNSVNYLIIRNNPSGAPYYDVTQNVEDINEANVIPVNTMLVTNTFAHMSHWDKVADGITNKLHMRFVKTQRYGYENGLVLTISGSAVNISEGKVWRGARRFSLLTANSNGSGNSDWFFYSRDVSGNWIENYVTNSTSAFNYTQYCDATGLHSLGTVANKYNINWFFRGVEDHQHGYYVLSDKGYKDLPSAKAETVLPPLPPEISTHAVLVGRAIFQQNISTPASIDSAFGSIFIGGSTIYDHNQLSGLQGGTITGGGEYYHLSSSNYTAVSNAIANAKLYAELHLKNAQLVGSADEPTLTTVASTAAGNTHWTELAYNDTTIQEAIWTVSSSVTRLWTGGGIWFRLRWISAATTGNVIWNIRMIGRTNNDPIDTPFDATSHSITVTPSSASNCICETNFEITPNAAELTASDVWFVAIRRNAPADTMVGDARLIDLSLYETT